MQSAQAMDMSPVTDHHAVVQTETVDQKEAVNQAEAVDQAKSASPQKQNQYLSDRTGSHSAVADTPNYGHGNLDQIQADVKSAMQQSPVAGLRDLQVEQKGESILISGRVSSYYQKQLAQEVVRHVSPRTRVLNSVKVD